MSNESIRIRTTPGSNANIRFKLEHDFNFLEILSLKISQEDLYQTFCSDYGVVVGRVIANKGFGVPNAKVSVFIPITSEDQKNVLIKDFYPFKTPYQKRPDGYRYNLLLSKQTCLLNKAVGSFPTKEDVLDNDIILEVFDKYYKYTTKTNDAGDFMIFGVPVGQQTVHMDVDLSDAGSISIRPYDLIAEGYPEKLFESRVEFKTSTNLDSLPQIKSANTAIDVIPFWGDVESCEIGITRVDFDTNFDVKTTALFFGSLFTDSGKMSLNNGCNPKNDQGEQDNLKTGEGIIKMIRANEYDIEAWFNRGELIPTNLEKFDINGGELIDENGVFAFPIPLNMGHVITDEYGNLVPSSDPSIGVATKGMYRFAMKFIEPNENPKFKTATIFFPSLGKDFGGTEGVVDTGSLGQANGTQDQRFTEDITQYDTSVYSNSRIYLDFHTFEWKQIYSIAHYIKKYKKGANRFSHIGVKNVDTTGTVNFFPFNNAIWKFDLTYYLLAFFIDFKAVFIKMMIKIISFCFKICVNINIGPFTILKKTIGPWNIISFCIQVCPYVFLGKVIGTFDLPCEGAPNDAYPVPPGGDWLQCNPQGCTSTTCSCPANCSGFNISTTGAGDDSICLQLLERWKCCTKLNLAEDRNVIRRIFNDSWVFGTAYLFQFKYTKKIKKKTGEIRKEKFCGPGADQRRGDNYVQNKCCLDSDQTCDRCLMRGQGTTRSNNQFRDYQDKKHNYAVEKGKVGSVDVKDVIYCNALMSTKIVSLGRIEMCQETLESIETAMLAGQALTSISQSSDFYTGTFFEDGWDPNFWVNMMRESSYEDAREILMYLGTKVNCNYSKLFSGGGGCHEYELEDGYPYFLMKEVCKIQNTVELGGSAPLEDEFRPLSWDNPYYDYYNDPPLNGGFSVNLDAANRFSPCGQDGKCFGLPNNNWTTTLDPEDNEATSKSWDSINGAGSRNNKNTRSNIPYYYFGINPGKTAINKLKKEYFVVK